MNRTPSVEVVLRDYFADDGAIAPDHILDMVADRISRQPKRRSWPFPGRTTVTQLKLAAALAAAVIVAVVGYNLLPRQSSVGGPSVTPFPSPAASTATASTATAVPSKGPVGFTSTTFAIGLSLVLGDGWSVAQQSPGAIELRNAGNATFLFDGSTLRVGPVRVTDPIEPWPVDWAAWLDSQPEFSPGSPRAAMIGGRSATRIDVDVVTQSGQGRPVVVYDAGTFTTNDFASSERWRFEVADLGGGSSLVILMVSPPQQSTEASAALDGLLETIAFR